MTTIFINKSIVALFCYRYNIGKRRTFKGLLRFEGPRATHKSRGQCQSIHAVAVALESICQFSVAPFPTFGAPDLDRAVSRPGIQRAVTGSGQTFHAVAVAA